MTELVLLTSPLNQYVNLMRNSRKSGLCKKNWSQVETDAAATEFDISWNRIHFCVSVCVTWVISYILHSTLLNSICIVMLSNLCSFFFIEFDWPLFLPGLTRTRWRWRDRNESSAFWHSTKRTLVWLHHTLSCWMGHFVRLLWSSKSTLANSFRSI